MLVLVLACSLLGAAPKAIWVWEQEALRLLGDRAYGDRVVALLKRHGIGTLYLHAEDYSGRDLLRRERLAYRQLLGRLHAAGLRVEALLGSYPMGAWERVPPDRDQIAHAMMQGVLDYNAAAPAAERFDGVQLDIEPHALDSWNETTRVELSRMFLTRSRDWVAMVRQAAPDLPVGAAIPFWYDGFEVEWEGTRKPMNAHVQALYDYVAVMDYRNHAGGPDGIIAHARTELATAAALGKRVVVGLETGDAEPAKVTFRHRGAGALDQEMATTERAFSRQSAFAGFAIHHLQAWMDLLTPTPSPSRP